MFFDPSGWTLACFDGHRSLTDIAEVHITSSGYSFRRVGGEVIKGTFGPHHGKADTGAPADIAAFFDRPDARTPDERLAAAKATTQPDGPSSVDAHVAAFFGGLSQ
jgi:hypothetical protein